MDSSLKCICGTDDAFWWYPEYLQCSACLSKLKTTGEYGRREFWFLKWHEDDKSFSKNWERLKTTYGTYGVRVPDNSKTPYDRMTGQGKIELMANSSLSHFQNLPAIERAVNTILHDIGDRGGFTDGDDTHIYDEMKLVYTEILRKVFDQSITEEKTK